MPRKRTQAVPVEKARTTISIRLDPVDLGRLDALVDANYGNEAEADSRAGGWHWTRSSRGKALRQALRDAAAAAK